MKGLIKIMNSYRVVKKQTGSDWKPLPNMDQYFLEDETGKQLSFWVDVPLGLNKDIVTTCIEIPKEIISKNQIIKEIPNHPLMQDTRKNLYTKQQELRYYPQFPMFNYGYLPQTWEQDITRDSQGYLGDNDPIDTIDLSKGIKQIGSIYQVKILGSFCLLDQGQIDWKIITMDAKQCETNNIDTIADIDPRLIEFIKRWFKIYKVYDGKQPNTIAFNQKVFSKEVTIQTVREVNQTWKELMYSPQQPYVERRKKFHLD